MFAKLLLSPPPPPPPPTPLPPPSISMKASGLRLDEGDFAGPENGEFGSTFARFLYVYVPVNEDVRTVVSSLVCRLVSRLVREFGSAFFRGSCI